jgi:MFS superfamily sulfate permease-like transporter
LTDGRAALGALLAAALRFENFVRGVTPTAEGWAPVPGPLAAVWFLVAFVITAATFWPLLAARRHPDATRGARRVWLLLAATAIRLLAPLVSFAGVLLLRAGVLKTALPPVVIASTVVVGCLAAVATLDSES